MYHDQDIEQNKQSELIHHCFLLCDKITNNINDTKKYIDILRKQSSTNNTNAQDIQAMKDKILLAQKEIEELDVQINDMQSAVNELLS